MKDNNFAQRLRFYRKKCGMSVEEVAEAPKKTDRSFSQKSIYSWETGTTCPTADTLMCLCEIYQIDDVLESFGYENRSIENNLRQTLTKHDLELIRAYRAHEELQPAINKLLDLPDEK